MILQATHTHLYPGHRGKISGATRIADLGAARDCVVEFADGSAAAATIAAADEDWLLQVEAHRTAAGTKIAAKHWTLRLNEDGDALKFRVLGRAQGGS